MEKNSLLSSQNQNNFSKLIILGLIFLLLFSAYNTCQNMVSQIYSTFPSEYKKLGNIILFIVYTCLMINGLAGSFYLKHISFKMGMFYSSFGYILLLGAGSIACSCDKNPFPESSICNTSVIYSVNIIGAAACGLGAGVIWLSQSGYTNNICDDSQKGKFFGTFWAMVQSSQILGNLLTAVLLVHVTHFVYFLTLLGIAVVAAFSFLLLPNVENKQSNESEQETPFLQTVKNVLKYSLSKEMMNLMMLNIFSGIVIGSYSGYLFQIINASIYIIPNDPSDASVKTAWVFFVLGIGEYVGGMTNSVIADLFNKKKICFFSLFLIIIALILSFVTIFVKNYILCFFAGFFWGCGDCYINSIINILISKDYNGKLEAFALYRSFQCIGVMLTQIIIIILGDNTDYWIFFSIISGFTFITLLSIPFIVTKDDDENKAYRNDDDD